MMKKNMLVFALFLFASSSSCYADNDDFGSDDTIKLPIDISWFTNKRPTPPMIPEVKFGQYNVVCGECHLAYQPALLPQKAWQQTLKSNEHFGQVLTISDVQLRTMRRYVIDNAADHVKKPIAEQISLSLKYHETDGRVSSSPFFTFVHKHVKIPAEQKIQQCRSCHSLALQGNYAIKP